MSACYVCSKETNDGVAKYLTADRDGDGIKEEYGYQLSICQRDSCRAVVGLPRNQSGKVWREFDHG